MPAVAFFEWTDDFIVGVPEVDAQHRRLVAILNGLLTAMSRHRERSVMEPILDEMVNYIDYHFSTEQRHLKGHPRFEEHLAQHREFLKKTIKLQKDFNAGTDISRDMALFLTDWLQRHILTMDRACFRDLPHWEA